VPSASKHAANRIEPIPESEAILRATCRLGESPPERP